MRTTLIVQGTYGALSCLCEEVRDLTISIKGFIEGDIERVTQALMRAEYGIAMDKLRKYNWDLATQVKHNEPKHWVAVKIHIKRRDRLNNNAMESWNNLMRSLRCMSISCLVSRHIHKLGLKVDKRKMEVRKWRNNVDDKIQKMLRRKHANIASVADVQ